MSRRIFGCTHTNSLGPRQSTTWANTTRKPFTPNPYMDPQLPFIALLSLYSTTTGFPFSTTKRPAPMKTPVSRSFSFSSPVSNFISITRLTIRLPSQNWEERSRQNTNGAKLGKGISWGEGHSKDLQELPNSVVFASGLPPKTNPSSGVRSTTPL